MTQAYPLQWPMARPRTRSRRDAQFGKMGKSDYGSWQQRKELSVADAVKRLQDEIERIGAREFVLSTNLQLRRDGLPRSDQRAPDDPGACVYFSLKGKPHALPCDTYHRVADNIAAIAKHIEATRAIERYGVATMAEMFTGFAALPGPATARAWWDVLGVSQHATVDQINAAWREKAKSAHSDAGGSDAAMSEINVARDAGLTSRAEQ
jgi:hypothetical protein